ncbi:TPA: IS1-like element transposase [Escherichia coli]
MNGVGCRASARIMGVGLNVSVKPMPSVTPAPCRLN